MKTALLFAAAAAVLGGCGSGSSGSSSSGSSSHTTTSGPDTGAAVQLIDVYDAPSGATLRKIFADNGTVSVLWEDSQSAGLTKVGPQASPTPIFTTPIANGVASQDGLPLAVAVGAGKAFYTSQGALHAVTMQTGSDQVLGMPGSCIPMFADDAAVFCALGGQVLSFSLPQGSMQMVADVSPSIVDDLYSDTTTLYIAAGSSSLQGTELWGAPRAGGSATKLATGSWSTGLFFFLPGDPPQNDAANLYLGVGYGIGRMSKSTYQIDVIFKNGDANGGCFGDANVSGAYFYYGCGEVFSRGPLAGGAPPTAVVDTSSANMALDDLVVSGDTAYGVTFLQAPCPGGCVAGHEAVEKAILPP